MAQPVSSSGRFTAVSGGVGTTVVSSVPTNFVRVIVPGTYVGTINFHDASVAGGTTATSQVFSLGLPASSIPFYIDVGIHCQKGLLYQATGTPVVTIVDEP